MRPARAGNVLPMITSLGLIFFAVTAVVVTMIAGQFPGRDNPLIPALSSGYYYQKGKVLLDGLADRLDTETLKNILRLELPVLALADKDDGATKGGSFLLLKSGLNLLAGVRLDDPLTYLQAEIPMLEAVPVTADPMDETHPVEITEPPNYGDTGDANRGWPTIVNRIASNVPLVGIYMTHTSETYKLTDGITHLQGKVGGVAAAAEEIARVLEEQFGIKVALDDTIHDSVYNDSYIRSEKTVRRLLQENPEMKLIFDIHRDANISREHTVAKINGVDAAKILIIVGTDARAEHPHWEQNLKLARLLAAKLDSLYPGLSRGITIKDGRYHQQYSPGALLIEIGSTENTVEEAVVSGRLFANTVVAVLNDLMEEGELVLEESD